MRRRGGIDALRPLLTRQLGSLEIARKIQEHTAPIVWNEVVGSQVAESTEVLGIDGGVLRVSAKSSVWAHELTFYKADILRRLNQRLGAHPADPIVRDIHFVNRGLRQPVAPTMPDTSDETLDDIPLSPGEMALVEESAAAIVDPDLRARVRAVRIADLKRRTWRLDHGWAPCRRCGDLVAPFDEGGGLGCPRCRLLP